ncbi:hypothetical protein N7470_006070 [Penicillium chermesinum]|nr:hypothetical protein N7470_006070 [Penicillium chermesinum]
MTVDISNSKQFASLVGQVQKIADNTRDNLSEADRVAALAAAHRLTQSLEKPRDAVIKMAFSSVQVTCVRIAMDMDVFTTLSKESGPLTLEELAAVKGADMELMERILRLLTAIGYVDEVGVRTYAATAMTHQLTDKGSIGAMKWIFDGGAVSLAKMPEYLRQTNFRNPTTDLRKGVLQYGEQMEMPVWEWIASRPDLNESFNSFMEGDRGDRPDWVDWFPVQERVIEGFQGGENDVLFVDVAGGRGHDLKSFQAKYPNAPGRLVLEDQPHVLEEAQVSAKIEKVPIDLFKEQPIQGRFYEKKKGNDPSESQANFSGARAYYMKYVLHDWSDTHSRAILEQIRNAMKKGYSKLILEEFIMPDKNAGFLSALWDLQMLVFCNSMERNIEQWNRLLSSTGFKLVKIWSPPGDGSSIIEAERV